MVIIFAQLFTQSKANGADEVMALISQNQLSISNF